MSNCTEFESLTDGLKKKSLPFVYVERNIYGVDYQVFIPETNEFEEEDAENLKEGLLKIIEILDEEINSHK